MHRTDVKTPAGRYPLPDLHGRGPVASGPCLILGVTVLVGLSLTASLANIGIALLQDTSRATLADFDASSQSTHIARNDESARPALSPVRLRKLETAEIHAFVIDPLTE